MYIRLIVCLVLIPILIYSQAQNNSKPFTALQLEILGGTGFESTNDFYGSFSFEAKTNLAENLNLKLNAGYSRYNSTDSYTVNTFKYVKIGDNYEKYHSITYDVKRIEYDIIPVSIGLQYILNRSLFSPYVLGDFNYNFFDPLPVKTPETTVAVYNSKNELPAEFQKPHVVENESYGMSAGVGTTYGISTHIKIDLRYLYKYDSELTNTHHILIGILF